MSSQRPLALVTGASRGIGAAVAAALAPTHDLLLGGRDATALATVAGGLGARALPWPVDLTDPAALAARDGADRRARRPRSLGRGRACWGPSRSSTADTWRRQFEVNVVAVAELTRLLLPALRAARGTVVCVNSGAGLPRGRAGGRTRRRSSRCGRSRTRCAPRSRRCACARCTRAGWTPRCSAAVVAHEGGTYDAARYLRPESVAVGGARGGDGLARRARHRGRRPAEGLMPGADVRMAPS